MKTEWTKTLLFVLAALGLVAAANWVEPEAAVPKLLSDEGQPLFPNFRNISAVKAIEVIDYDPDQAIARPLKVEFRKGRWILSSHHDYPAAATGRLEKTAGALFGLKKDLVVSDRIEDQATYGVIDPLDTKVTTLTGRGKHVTLRGAGGEILADMVLGKPMPDHKGYRYVRLPGHRRIYGVKTNADPSARFADWVSSNLLRLSPSRIRKITINSYSIDENFGRIANMRRTVLTRNGGKWTQQGAGKLGNRKIRQLASTLGAIHIVGARPKPKPLAEQLRQRALAVTLATVMSLRQHGFFITNSGRLFANEGELNAETNRGLVYTLRFGEIVRGSNGAETAGKEAAATGTSQDRYLFITVRYDPKVAARYGASTSTAAYQRRARDLNNRFADWYYVLSGADFAKLHPE